MRLRTFSGETQGLNPRSPEYLIMSQVFWACVEGKATRKDLIPPCVKAPPPRCPWHCPDKLEDGSLRQWRCAKVPGRPSPRRNGDADGGKVRDSGGKVGRMGPEGNAGQQSSGV